MDIAIDKISIEDGDFLWKYMDIHKFLYLLLENKIFFNRMDLFPDPLEAMSDKMVFDKFSCDITPARENMNPNIPKKTRDQISDNRERQLKEIEFHTKQIQKSLYTSCWYTSSRESMAMWNLYSNRDSVAIRFNANELISTIGNEAKKQLKEYKMTIGSCEYRKIYPPELDPKKREEIKNTFVAHKKDISYEHEREFRFVLYKQEIDESNFGFGLKVPELKNLEFFIVANPYMESWQYDNLKKLLKEKFNIEKKFQNSQLLIKK